MRYRIEKDSLGRLKVPAEAYWGIHTQRALENFYLSGRPVSPLLIAAYCQVKQAAAEANRELKLLDEKKAAAIVRACAEIIQGKFRDQFPVDALQGGAGTSTNMNVNEVLANRANEILRGRLGVYKPVDPIEDVNLNQSTNDTYPTALKIAVIYRLRELSRRIAALQGAFQKKEKEFAAVVKIGRTELQEAVPVTLGQEFGAFAEAFARDRWRTFKCEERLRVVNIGGTAVGTGLTAPRSYIYLVIEILRRITGIGLARGETLLDATANSDAFAEASGILKAHAVNLIKVSSDLRLLNLLGEIRLPALQAGSSIMPGKVNPVVPEAAIQAGIRAMCEDLAVSEACSSASLQINEFMPLLAQSILDEVDILLNAGQMLCGCIKGIRADKDKCSAYFNASPAIVAALLPYIGYGKAESLLEAFRRSGGVNLREFLEKKLGKKLIRRIFDPYNLTSLGYRKNGKNA
ncbi:MAG: aspartate ammonia-lyase [Candidatus Omnitrophota bacterium]